MEKHKNLPTQVTTKSSKRSAQAIAFSAHIRELRSRIFWVAMVFIVGAGVAYGFREILIDVVLSPIGSEKLIYLNPAGGFSFIFQIIMYAGGVLAAPFLVFQLYKFVVPALPLHARKHAWAVFLSAFGLMLAGVCFGYFVAIPASLNFLTTFAEGYVEASLTADSYLNFVLAYVAGLGLLFQLPLLLILFHWVKPLTPKGLMNSQRFLIVFAFVAAAIITPTPDALNQVLIAGPIIGIYQIGTVTVLLMIQKEKRRLRRSTRRQSQPVASAAPLMSLFPELPGEDDLVVRPRRAMNVALAPAKTAASAPAPVRRVSVKPLTQGKSSVTPGPQPVVHATKSTLRYGSLARATHSRPTLDTIARPSLSRPLQHAAVRRPTLDSYGTLARSL